MWDVSWPCQQCFFGNLARLVLEKESNVSMPRGFLLHPVFNGAINTSLRSILQGHIDRCLKQIDAILPSYLKAPPQPPLPVSPDSTSNIIKPAAMTASPIEVDSSTHPSSSSPEVDLACAEVLSNESCEDVDESGYFGCRARGTPEHYTGTAAAGDSRSSSPLSAVDIFTDFNTNVLQAAYAEAEAGGVDPAYSILVS